MLDAHVRSWVDGELGVERDNLNWQSLAELMNERDGLLAAAGGSN